MEYIYVILIIAAILWLCIIIYYLFFSSTCNYGFKYDRSFDLCVSVCGNCNSD